MRILILGVSGLIGHTLLLQLRSIFDTYGTLHHAKENYGNVKIFSSRKIIDNINVTKSEDIESLVKNINPDVILNCVGITKRKITNCNISQTIETNALFPHKLTKIARTNLKRVIHFSTDCVFDGAIGNYSEKSTTTAIDLYGRTKALGEIYDSNVLTIRSSFIGLELYDKTELLEWFLKQSGNQISGFRNTFYSGVSTIFMARVVKNIILEHQNLQGLYQLAPITPISKYDLLTIAKNVFRIKVDIIPDIAHFHLPTLNGDKLRKEMNLVIPSWEKMMQDLSSNMEFYKNLNS
jgi:dTDP-4-dehydrorhamnose reductase